eukprot:6185921-Pleurochrysis_carterae.AAC.2
MLKSSSSSSHQAVGGQDRLLTILYSAITCASSRGDLTISNFGGKQKIGAAPSQMRLVRTGWAAARDAGAIRCSRCSAIGARCGAPYRSVARERNRNAEARTQRSDEERASAKQGSSAA